MAGRGDGSPGPGKEAWGHPEPGLGGRREPWATLTRNPHTEEPPHPQNPRKRRAFGLQEEIRVRSRSMSQNRAEVTALAPWPEVRMGSELLGLTVSPTVSLCWALADAPSRQVLTLNETHIEPTRSPLYAVK